ncbi:MAG: ribosome maturation factor RimM [Methylocystis sp.]|uniref:ribosome maturation factor RimM n=1 Tax=Methylocystis sp. TaxID=1911079 RepID=UPI003DA501E9
MTKTNLVLLGRFGAPHGVRGEIRLQSYTGDPVAIATYGPLTDRRGAASFRLLSVRPQGKDILVARVEGVADRSGAEALTGVELFIARDRLPAPEDEEEFYLTDLVGLSAQTRASGEIGTVIAVRNFGAGDILEVAPAGGGETLLFPFTKAVVPVVAVAQGRVVIEPPAEVETETGEG